MAETRSARYVAQARFEFSTARAVPGLATEFFAADFGTGRGGRRWHTIARLPAAGAPGELVLRFHAPAPPSPTRLRQVARKAARAVPGAAYSDVRVDGITETAALSGGHRVYDLSVRILSWASPRILAELEELAQRGPEWRRLERSEMIYLRWMLEMSRTPAGMQFRRWSEMTLTFAVPPGSPPPRIALDLRTRRAWRRSIAEALERRHPEPGIRDEIREWGERLRRLIAGYSPERIGLLRSSLEHALALSVGLSPVAEAMHLAALAPESSTRARRPAT